MYKDVQVRKRRKFINKNVANIIFNNFKKLIVNNLID